jgi:hypothetical protein
MLERGCSIVCSHTTVLEHPLNPSDAALAAMLFELPNNRPVLDWVLVRMPFHSQAPVRLLELIFRRSFINTLL